MLSPPDALDMPAALARIWQTISQMVAPLAELQAMIPIIKPIARLYEGQTSGKPEYMAAVLERVATEEEASGVFARCAEDLSKHRESFLSRG